jgi:hypothetical protein
VVFVRSRFIVRCGIATGGKAMLWIANRGQLIQIVLAAASCIFAGIKVWPELRGNQFLSLGAILFYVLVALVVVLTTRALVVRTDNGPTADSVKAQDIVKLRSATLDPRATDAGTNYKAKLRCVFTNQSDKAVEILPPGWLSNEGDVGLQSPVVFRYQLESSLGSWKQDHWNTQELKKVQVEPGESFRIWVGLDASKAHEYLEGKKRHFS